MQRLADVSAGKLISAEQTENDASETYTLFKIGF